MCHNFKERRNTNSPWLTITEAAKRLKLSKRTVQNYINAGKIQIHKSETGTIRLLITDVDDFLKPYKQNKLKTP